MARTFFGKLHLPNSQEGLGSGSPYLPRMQFGMQLCSAYLAENLILIRQEEFPWCFTLNAVTITLVIVK